MELNKYYSLDECTNIDKVIKMLTDLEDEGKIEYDIENTTDVFYLEDIDLEDCDIESLVKLFDNYEVFPYLDKDDDDYDGDYDDSDDYYNNY